jgi:hypothetical protein
MSKSNWISSVNFMHSIFHVDVFASHMGGGVLVDVHNAVINLGLIYVKAWFNLGNLQHVLINR